MIDLTEVADDSQETNVAEFARIRTKEYTSESPDSGEPQSDPASLEIVNEQQGEKEYHVEGGEAAESDGMTSNALPGDNASGIEPPQAGEVTEETKLTPHDLLIPEAVDERPEDSKTDRQRNPRFRYASRATRRFWRGS